MGVHCYGLRDDQRARIEGMLPGRKGSVGRPAGNNRLFVEAVLYRYRAGIPWRDLPERFGDFRVVHTRFSRWAKRGVWKKLFKHLAQDADNEYAMIDSTIARAHQHGAGALKKGARSKAAMLNTEASPPVYDPGGEASAVKRVERNALLENDRHGRTHLHRP